MKTSMIVLSFVAAAFAGAIRRNGGGGKGVGEADKQCGATQVVSCCNPSDETSSSGLISLIAGPIVGNGCVGISANAVNVLDGLVDADGLCGSNTVSCCTGNKNTGLIVVDLQCSSL